MTAFPPKTYQTINGFSNLFFGWGGEDDNIGKRCLNKGFRIKQDPHDDIHL